MPESRRIVRIFISSPGDVIEERDQARKVIEGLEQQYPGVTLQPVLWEELALPATASFQKSIDFLLNQKPIDVAVFILWSRLGTPLGPGITRPDGTPYRSGTEREFDLMLAAFDRSGRKRPVILAYTRDDYAGFQHKLAEAPSTDLELLIAQRRLAEQFIREQFTDVEGHNVRASYSYREPISFAKRLRAHLRQALDELLETDTGSWPDEPYRALDRFEVEHARIFCGRYEETSELVERLHDQQAGCAFVAIIGASGSGKSSLARAGVAASLLQHSGDEGVKQWRALFFLPAVEADDLLPRLTRGLAQCVPELGNSEAALASIADGLRRDAPLTVQLSLIPALARAAETAGGPVRLLVVLDQMEELWTDRRITPENREQFFDCIEALARSGRVSVLATLRSDFYAHAQQMPTFLRIKGERGHFDLLPPDTAALRRIIAEPARLAGLTFERHEQTGRTLDELVLQDATRDPGALPLVQYALAELYRQRDREHRQLTFAAYRAMEGVEGALGKRADELFNQLPPESRAALPEILPLLVTVDIGGEQAAVRRRAPKAELITTPQRTELTEKLIDGRFLTTDQQNGVAVIGLAHEALLRRWGQISNWIASNRDHLRIRARVEQSHERWQQQRRHESLLLQPGLPLEEARTLLKAAPHLLFPATADYIRTSIALDQQHIRQSRRRRRLVTSALSVLALLAVIAAAYALTRQREANARREEAVQAKNRAIKLADDNASLAATEKQSRQRADEQSQLALATLKSVVFDIQSKLENVPAAEEVRQDLLNKAIAGLEKVARGLKTAPEADHALVWSHLQLGDTFLLFGSSAGSSATDLAQQEYETACKIARTLVEQHRQGTAAQHDLIASYDRLVLVNLHRGNVAAALKAGANELKVAVQTAAAQPHDIEAQSDLAKSYGQLGDVNIRAGNFGAGREDCEREQQIFLQLAQADPHDTEKQNNLAESYARLGNANMQLGNIAAASENYERSLRIGRQLANANPHDVGLQRDLSAEYTSLGDAKCDSGNVAVGREEYQLAAKIIQQLADADPHDSRGQRDLASAYERLSETSLSMGDLPSALASAQSVLKIRRRVAAADPHDARAQSDLSDAYTTLGRLSIDSNQFQPAHDAFAQELSILRNLSLADPADADVQVRLSQAYADLGDTNLRLGDLESAQSDFEQSLQPAAKLVQQNEQNSRAQDDLAYAQGRLGALFYQLGNAPAAIAHYGQALKIRLQRAAADPHDANVQNGLGTIYDKLGDLNLKVGDLARARENYQHALAIDQRAAQIDARNAETQAGVGYDLGKLGMLEVSRDDFASAGKQFAAGIGIMGALEAAGKIIHPEDADMLRSQRRELQICLAAPRAIDDIEFALKQPAAIAPELLAVRGRALARRGQLGAAAATAQKLVALNFKVGDNLYWASGIYALASAADPRHGQAKSPSEQQSRDSDAVQAVKLLKQAQAAGYFKSADNRIALAYDHNLDSLRGRDDFKKLLAEIIGPAPRKS